MKGTILGDIIGSRFEFKNNLSKEFDLFADECRFTDDTVCTIATMDWLMSQDKDYSFYLKKWCRKYPNAGYSPTFWEWVSKGKKPYGSFGNGAGMRVSPVGLYGTFIGQVLMLAEMTANATHNHPEGIKAAKAIALAVYLAKTGNSKPEIKSRIENLGYNVELPKKKGVFDTTSQATIPQAVACFIESNSFEDTIRTAISIGGDSDTIAAMSGAIAEVFYGIDKKISDKLNSYLPKEFIDIINRFYKYCDDANKLSSSDMALKRFTLGFLL